MHMTKRVKSTASTTGALMDCSNQITSYSQITQENDIQDKMKMKMRNVHMIKRKNNN